MEYMFLLTVDESQMPDSPATDTPEGMDVWLDYNQLLVDGGHWVSGGSLTRSTTATTLHLADGAVAATTDGPFAETKEQVAGYYVVKAADLDEALTLAGKVPLPYGAIEVRPLQFRPDA